MRAEALVGSGMLSPPPELDADAEAATAGSDASRDVASVITCTQGCARAAEVDVEAVAASAAAAAVGSARMHRATLSRKARTAAEPVHASLMLAPALPPLITVPAAGLVMESSGGSSARARLAALARALIAPGPAGRRTARKSKLSPERVWLMGNVKLDKIVTEDRRCDGADGLMSAILVALPSDATSETSNAAWLASKARYVHCSGMASPRRHGAGGGSAPACVKAMAPAAR